MNNFYSLYLRRLNERRILFFISESWNNFLVFTAHIHNTYGMLLAFSNEHHDAALTLAPSATHPLHQPNGRLVSIEAHNEVNFTYVETLFSYTSRDESVIAPRFESAHYLQHTQQTVTELAAEKLHR
jgi:hypothetical protein